MSDSGARGIDVAIGIEGSDDVPGDGCQRLSFGRFSQRSAVVGGKFAVKPGQ